MKNIDKLRTVLSQLSDGELSAVSNSFTNNSDLDSIKNQLVSKSNLGYFDFSKRDLSNSLINEFTNRLLSKNIDLGKRNKIVTFLKNLSKFRFSYKKS